MDEMESELNEKGMDSIPENPPKMTDSLYYDSTNAYRGVALIFNHRTFSCLQQDRNGTEEDGFDLENVLNGLQFDVRSYMDLTLEDIQEVLYDVSKEDHSENDCLWVTVMSHGYGDGLISSANNRYNVQELWKNFLGEKCESLIGKPKLFFIEASKSKRTEEFVTSNAGHFETPHFISPQLYIRIPKLADCLVMYSTTSFFNSSGYSRNESCFIQALCNELKTNPENELMRILTAVNARVYSYGSYTIRWCNAEQTSMIQSTLTKSFFFKPKTTEVEIRNGLGTV